MSFASLLDVVSSDKLSLEANLFKWLTVSGVCYAAYWNYRASRVARALRPAFTVNFAFSIVYLVAYLWLIVADVEYRDWASFMGGISFVTFYVVWGNPGRNYTHLVERLREDVKKECQKEDCERQAEVDS